jgi:hypothetical protein
MRLLGVIGVALTLSGCAAAPALTGETVARPSGSAPVLTPTSSPAATSAGPAAGPCPVNDQWRYIHSPGRLHLVRPCVEVSGRVVARTLAPDGDGKLWVALDSPYAEMLNSANDRFEGADLVVEAVCAGRSSKPVTTALCATDPDPLRTLPVVGQAVRLLGPEVLDIGHAGWVEIHPLLAWERQDAGGAGASPARGPRPS